MKHVLIPVFLLAVLVSCKTDKKDSAKTTEAKADSTANAAETKAEKASPIITITEDGIDITPISHASMVLSWDNTVMYVDPVGGEELYKAQEKPDVILVTDIHGDHLNAETIAAVYQPDTKIIVPQAVKDKMPADWQDKVTVLKNDQDTNVADFNIKGIPMYNLREEAKDFHTKGRGNGYVIEHNDKRVYISGDTEDIPEMRNLKDIDIAFVCMNLPYTMPVDKAAEAVLDFKPGTVYPYHYRGKDGLSDINKFKSLVNKGNTDVKVEQLDWYPKQ